MLYSLPYDITYYNVFARLNPIDKLALSCVNTSFHRQFSHVRKDIYKHKNLLPLVISRDIEYMKNITPNYVISLKYYSHRFILTIKDNTLFSFKIVKPNETETYDLYPTIEEITSAIQNNVLGMKRSLKCLFDNTITYTKVYNSLSFTTRISDYKFYPKTFKVTRKSL